MYNVVEQLRLDSR